MTASTIDRALNADLAGSELTLREARDLAVIATRLDKRPRPSHDPKVQRARLHETIRALGCVQLDTISVISRSHETVLWSRLGSYDPDLITELYEPGGALTEYLGHAASIMPTTSLRLYRSYMEKARQRDAALMPVLSIRRCNAPVLGR